MLPYFNRLMTKRGFYVLEVSRFRGLRLFLKISKPLVSGVTIQFRAVCDGRGKALESPIPPKSQW